MRLQWIVSIISTLASMGLLVFMVAQYQMLIMLNKGNEKQLMQSGALDNQFINDEFFKVALEKLVVQGEKVVAELEASLAKLKPAMKETEMNNDACQAEKKPKTDELMALLKEKEETEAAFKAESEAWQREMDTLRAQLTEYRPICDHVKKDSLAVKLCGPKPTEPLMRMRQENNLSDQMIQQTPQ